MNQEDHINNVMKMRPKGFDPLLETHREKNGELEYSSWTKYEGQSQVDERSVMPNEIIVDIDEGDTKQRRKETKKVVQFLENNGLPFFAADTGGTGFHIHIFFEKPEGLSWKEINPYRIALYDWLKQSCKDNVNSNIETWDDGVADFDAEASKGHLIRSVGGRKADTGNIKTVVTPSALEKKNISSQKEVEYPQLRPSIDYWKISKLDGEKSDLTWSKIQEKADEIQEEREKKNREKLESTYEAEDDGLQVLREIPAQEVLKAFYGIEVEEGESLYCPVHDSDEDGSMEATVNDGKYICFGDSCCEKGESSHYHNAIDILVESKRLDYSFQGAKDELAGEFDVEITEVTEGTEATEAGSLVNELLNEESVEKVRLSGKLDEETYFHTLFLQKGNKTKKVVVTSDKQICEVKNNLERLKQKKRDQASEDEEPEFDFDEEDDYEYFVVNNQEYRFKHKTAKFNEIDLYTPDNKFLEYFKDKEINQEVYDLVKSEVKRYWDHYNDEWFDVVTAWIIHTYLVNGIGYTGYIILKGKEDTGKSTLQKVIARLAYNGFFSGKSTPAVTSRLAHFTQATINLDEFEKNADDEVQGVFNTGQRKGAKYSFTNMNKDEIEDQITSLYSFCPKTLSVNSLYEFDSHFLSRAYILEATRTTRSIEKIENTNKEDENKFRDFRNDLLAYSLFNHREIISAIENYRENLDFSGRESDKIGLICGIVKHFKSESRADELKEFIADKKELQEEQINQRLKVLFERIIEEFDYEDREIKIKPSVLATHVNRELEIDEDYKMSSRSVGNRLRDYDILRDSSQSNRSGSDGSTVYTIPREYLVDSFTRYGLTSMRDKLDEIGNEQGSVASVPSVTSVDDEESKEDEPFRPQHEVVKAAARLDAIGKRDGIKREYSKIQDESGLDPGDFEEIFEKMESEGLVHEQKAGEYVLDKKLSPDNQVMM
jgi:hypothetical protein